MSNPFDLTKLISGAGLVEKKQYKPDVITSNEKKQLLVGYEKLPQEKWLQIFPGSHIRYIRKDGEMRKGGYVRYIDANNKFLYISTAPIDTNAKGWKLPLNGVAEIWIMNDKRNAVQYSQPADIREEISSIKDDIQQIKLEIQRVTNQQKRIINLIGKTIQKSENHTQ